MQGSVLVVDDLPSFRRLMRALLEQFGLGPVYEAADGSAAIEEALRVRPDLITLDLAMPKMDGLAAAERLATLLPGTPVVIISGFDELALRHRAEEAGVAAFVVKPFEQAELRARLEQVLALAAARQAHPVG